MRRRLWPILVGTLLLPLLLCGLAKAQFSDSETLEARVAAGHFDLLFTSASSNDAGETDDPGKCPPAHVGCTEASIDSSDPDILLVGLTNGYPGYEALVTFEALNAGSIDARVLQVLLDGTPLADPSLPFLLDLDGNENDDLELTLTGPLPDVVIESGDTIAGTLCMRMPNMEDDGWNADYGVDGDFTLEIAIGQWNQTVP